MLSQIGVRPNGNRVRVYSYFRSLGVYRAYRQHVIQVNYFQQNCIHVFIFFFRTGSSYFAGYLWVLDTDYENFAMVHSCDDYILFNYQLNWLYSRTQTLETGDVQDALREFEDAGIYVTSFIESDQTGCSEF